MQIMGDLSLEHGVEVGANVTFYPNVDVGENTKILPGAVIGRPPIRAGTTNRPIDRGDASVRIGSDCVIGANCVLYTNLRIGNNVLIGDLASLREGCRLEDDTVVGRGVMMMYGARVQSRSRIIDGAIITGNMLIEPDVFIGPGVNTVNDNDVYLKRFGLTPFESEPRQWSGALPLSARLRPSAPLSKSAGALSWRPARWRPKMSRPWTIVAGVPARELKIY